MNKMMCGLVLLLCIGVASASTVTREISEKKVIGGDQVSVNLEVSIDDGSSYYVIMEKVPSGWTVTGSDGDYTSNPSYVFWGVLNAEGDASHYYTIQSPEVRKDTISLFSGTYGFEYKQESRTEGDTRVLVQKKAQPRFRILRWRR